MDSIFQQSRIMIDWFWNLVYEWRDPKAAAAEAAKEAVKEAVKEAARVRHAVFRREFFNDTKPCNTSEVLFIQRNMCLAPSSPPANETVNPTIGILPDLIRYSALISILLFLGISLAYWMKPHSRRFHSSARVVKQFTKKENNDAVVRTPTILVVGANKTGKRSVISAFKKMYPESQTWNFITQNFSEDRIPISPKLDLIWLIVNYQASIHDNEFKILKNVGDIPVILIINKVDLLHEININDGSVIRDFDKQVPRCLKNYDRLIGIRERLLRFDKQILIVSLRQEEDDDRALGMNNLIDITNDWLSNQTLASHVQNSPDYDTVYDELKAIRNGRRMQNSSIRVLLIGYTNAGKSSLINYLAGSSIAMISLDGLPVTQGIKEYSVPDLNLILMDSMGFTKKRDNTKKLDGLRKCPPPDFIWFLVNYQSSIEDEELNLINELFPLIPTIIVVNFMDMLQMLNHDVDFETDTQRTNRQYQIERQRLLQFKQSQTNVRGIIAVSLRSEEQDDRPRGVQVLYKETIKNFLKDTYA